MKIGIIGAGFVGGAVKNAYDTHNVDVLVRDPFKGFDTSIEEIKTCDVVYVCVPTPQSEDGAADSSYLESVLDDLKGFNGVIISKSTLPPSVYVRLSGLYPNLVHAPEFLVAATANEDYIKGTFGIIGGRPEYTKIAEEAIRLSQRELQQVKHCTIEEASMAKYVINTSLALKVAYLNQVATLCNRVGADYDKVIDMVKMDTRQGHSHFDVPGPDGEYGFGGACFPKDTAALAAEARGEYITFDILETAIRYNKTLRNDI